MGDTFVDPKGFTPLEPALHDVLISLDFDERGNYSIQGCYNNAPYEELMALGYLSSAYNYFDGEATGTATTKGKRYRSDYADWNTRRNAWETTQLKQEEAAKSHDWHITHANGLYAIGGAIAGAVLTLILTKLFP